MDGDEACEVPPDPERRFTRETPNSHSSEPPTTIELLRACQPKGFLVSHVRYRLDWTRDQPPNGIRLEQRPTLTELRAIRTLSDGISASLSASAIGRASDLLRNQGIKLEDYPARQDRYATAGIARRRRLSHAGWTYCFLYPGF